MRGMEPLVCFRKHLASGAVAPDWTGQGGVGASAPLNSPTSQGGRVVCEEAITESGPQQSETNSERKMEARVVSEGKKRRKYLPRELRIKAYNRVIELRQQDRSYNEIRAIIKQEYGIVLSKSHISDWVRGLHNPYNGRRMPSLDLLEPSEDLAYVISVSCDDEYVKVKRSVWKGYRQVVIYLEAKDREFVEEFVIRIGRVLNRPSPKVNVRSTGYYYVGAESRTLYQLLKKPIDLDKIRKFVEHREKCSRNVS
jgi:hypothetical protein